MINWLYNEWLVCILLITNNYWLTYECFYKYNYFRDMIQNSTEGNINYFDYYKLILYKAHDYGDDWVLTRSDKESYIGILNKKKLNITCQRG